MTFPHTLTDDDFFVKIEGEKSGKTVAILCSIHGNERVGQDIAKEVANWKLDAGTLYLIGGNPRAYEQNVRGTDANMNRCFGDPQEVPYIAQHIDSYERKCAEKIMPLLDKCDGWVDIHQCNKDRTFSIPHGECTELAKKLDFPIMCTGYDTTHKGSTAYYASVSKDSTGNTKPGMTLELGWIHECDESVYKQNKDKGLDACERFLIEMGLIDKQPKPLKFPNPVYIHATYIYKTKSNFSVQGPLSDFDRLREGMTLGTDGEEVIICPAEWDGKYIMFPRNRDTADHEGFVIGERRTS